MTALLGIASLVLSLVGLLAAVSGSLFLAAGLLTLAVAALVPIGLRGPRQISLGGLVHFFFHCACMIGIFLCLHMLAAQRGWQWDLTAGDRQSLSPLSVQQIRALPQPVEIIGVTTDPTDLRPLLDRLTALSPRLRYRILNPVRDHFEVMRLAQTLGITSLPDGSVIFRTEGPTGPRRTVVQALERTQTGIELRFDEQRWVNAMIQITRAEPPTVFFTLDHGERSLATEFTAMRGIFSTLGFLEDHGSARSIPESVDLIVIAGPQRDFSPIETSALQQFIAGGGGVLALIDPPPPGQPDALTNLRNWIESNGVTLMSGVAAEDDPSGVAQLAGYPEGRTVRVANANSTHPVTESLDPLRTPLLMPIVQPLEVGAGDGVRPSQLESILTTNSSFSWTTPDDGPVSPSDVPPPGSQVRRSLTLAIAAIPNISEGGRLVVIGDSDWACDRMQNETLRVAAERLMRGAVGWLVEDEDLISIPAREAPTTPMILTIPQMRMASAVAVILLPELLLALGITLMVTRARVGTERRSAPTVLAVAAPVLAVAGLLALGARQPILAPLLIAASLLMLLLLSLQAQPHRGRGFAATLGLVGGAAVAVLALLLASRGGDAAPISVHPLFARTLQNLARDVSVTTVSGDSQSHAELFDAMTSLTTRVQTHRLDPDTDQEEIGALMTEQSTRLGNGESLLMRHDGLARKVTQGVEEQRWAINLAQLGRRNPMRALLTEGHGELGLRDQMPALEMILRQMPLVPEQHPLGPDDRPEVIIVAGPTEDFPEEDLALLDAQLDRGGSVLVFLDPPTGAARRIPGRLREPRELPRLVGWLEERGHLSMPPAIVVHSDARLNALGYSPIQPAITYYALDHPITRRAVQRVLQDGAPPAFEEVRPVNLKSGPPPLGVVAVSLMRTTSDAWPETNLELLLREQQFMRDPGEEPAEQSVGAAVLHVGDSRTGRLLVLGDSDLLVGLTPNDNPVIQILLGSVLRWAMPEDNLAFFADAGARVSTADAKANSDQWKLLVLAGLLALGGLLSLAWKREVQGTRQASLAPLAAAGLVILVVSASGLVERPALSGADSGGSAHVVSHAPGQVRQVEIATAAGIVTLTRENTGWARQALDDQSPWTDEDSARVDLLLGVLESAPRGSEQAITSGVDMSLLGLSEPRLQLTLTDNDGEAETVAFGGYPESAPGQIMGYTQVWARRTGEDKVFTVPDGLFALAAQLAPTVDEESPEPGAEPTP